MAKYKLVFKASVAKDLRAIPKKDVTRILQRIDALQDQPRPSGCEKLSGEERFRVRQRDYRIVYEIEDLYLIVTVIRVGHRRQVYLPR